MEKDIGFVKKLGVRLRMIRHQKGVSMEQLAHNVGTSFSQIARIERGEINTTIQTLKNITDGLDISLSKLFNFTDSNE